MNKHIQRPIIFGEVLYDCFPDGSHVLGGAPFNVAWHLQGFGLNPLMISCVGNDVRGKDVRNTMKAWGMDVEGLQEDEAHPTGQVLVKLNNGQPSYDIVTGQAYDHINNEILQNVIKNIHSGLIYHGSLATRHKVSQAALASLLESFPDVYGNKRRAAVFLDLNLRDPWWKMSQIDKMIQRATWVKLNDEELCEVVGHSMKNSNALKVYAKELFQHYRLEWLIVTRGERGAFVVSHEGIIENAPVKVDNLQDTVGAGDAFSAVTIMGIIQNWSIQTTLEKALRFSSLICQQRGATEQNPTLYNI